MFILRDRRGVSEVLSAILIILIAVSMGLGLFTYSTGVFGTTQGNFLSEAQTRKEKVEERFTSTAAYWEGSDGGGNNSIYFAIYNYGKTEVTIAAVYVNAVSIEKHNLKFQGEDGEWKEVPETGCLIKIYGVTWFKVETSALSHSTVVVASRRGNTVEFEL
ncbi:MAG: hypothetical protein GTN80_09085 [Nitrososphaeria archaeon]|nr:hypothetical protein [Nitrososphaeria archaeon]NIN53320.1 hypothetical protein [Nitrososphaeria archaeon]NIQ33773.1 hypothetical protein [Nitrososphaeria archaeon]